MMIIQLPDCPKDRAYVVDPKALGTLARYPQVAEAIANGDRVVISGMRSGKRQLLEEVEQAVQRVACSHVFS